ncbi:DnaJ domain-containing protein [Halomonas sp. WWR20]
MANTRFSPFELLLLKSRSQTDTAALLLLAWVVAHKASITENGRQRLLELSRHFRHGHELQPVIDIANAQDLEAIQLAAEVLQKDRYGEPAVAFLRQAIELSMVDGSLAPTSNYLLRFLADLLGASPRQFEQLFHEVAGKAFADPDDLSRADYWQAREQARQRQQEERASHQQERGSHHQERSSHQQRGSSYQRQDSSRQQDGSSSRRPHDRPRVDSQTLHALIVLGLEAGASREEIKRAYRRLAQAHHPDRFFSRGESVVANASRRFQRIKNAYEFLMHDARSL